MGLEPPRQFFLNASGSSNFVNAYIVYVVDGVSYPQKGGVQPLTAVENFIPTSAFSALVTGLSSGSHTIELQIQTDPTNSHMTAQIIAANFVVYEI